jgi:hypothetical protein
MGFLDAFKAGVGSIPWLRAEPEVRPPGPVLPSCGTVKKPRCRFAKKCIMRLLFHFWGGDCIASGMFYFRLHPAAF